VTALGRLAPWLLLAAAACKSSSPGMVTGPAADTGAAGRDGALDAPSDTGPGDAPSTDAPSTDTLSIDAPSFDTRPPDSLSIDSVEAPPPADAPPADAAAASCEPIGSPCTKAEETCSTADSVEIACRQIRVCRFGRWQAAQSLLAACQAGTARACPALPPVQDTACTLQYQLCAYPNGTSCGCVTGCERGVDAGGPCIKPLLWACRGAGGPPCPPGPPALGAPCGSQPAQCIYGPSCSALTVQCTNARWQLGLYAALGGCG